MLSTIMGDYCLECWKQRNKTLYGKEKEESKKKMLKKGKKEDLLRGSKNFSIFDMPLYI